jgi:T4 RnlA family RNA ligase
MHESLYLTLLNLVQNNEAFYFQDFERDGSTFRIFNYRLASYTDFLSEGAMEARGIMFEIKPDGKFVRLACRPQPKFFNLNENPMTMNLDLRQVEHVGLKVDGSLISTYWTVVDGERVLRLKTKGSLFSDQAMAAERWLSNHQPLYDELLQLCVKGYTVNMEWCAPDNRVVIGYLEPQLIVLNVRDNETGEVILVPNDLGQWFPQVSNKWVDMLTITDPVSFVAGIPAMQGVEGFVVSLADGMTVKCKTEWYLVQHRAKDSINSDRRLFETVLEEATDDLRSLFHDDPLVIQRIADMEQKVEKIYNHMVRVVEDFYLANKDLSRKDYAIKGQAEIEPLYFGLVMNKYVGKPTDYKQFLKSKYKQFGINDDPEPSE